MTFQNGITSIKFIRFQQPFSISNTILPGQTVDIVLPTYILKPNENEKFYPSQVKKIAYDTLFQEIDRANINERWMEEWADFGNDLEDLAKDIVGKIRDQCKKELDIPRYKLIGQVTIGQRKDQGVRITSRCLWDTSTDQYASASYQNEYIWASALVFGLYTE